MHGNLKDRSSLDAVCAGMRSVITTANSAQRGGEDNVATVDLEGDRSLIDAGASSGVRHFIFAGAERHLRESGVNWTVIAPHIFMDVWFPMIFGSAFGAGRPVPLVGGGKRRHSFISVDDV